MKDDLTNIFWGNEIFDVFFTGFVYSNRVHYRLWWVLIIGLKCSDNYETWLLYLNHFCCLYCLAYSCIHISIYHFVIIVWSISISLSSTYLWLKLFHDMNGEWKLLLLFSRLIMKRKLFERQYDKKIVSQLLMNNWFNINKVRNFNWIVSSIKSYIYHSER